jgi:small-conductance mechanosensitive channel
MDFSHWYKKNFGNNDNQGSTLSLPPPPEEKKKPDSIQRQINNNLDNILNTQRKIIELKKDKSLSAAQKKKQTSILKSQIKQFESELNRITNEGTQINGLFNNVYYINDVFEDKRCNS